MGWSPRTAGSLVSCGRASSSTSSTSMTPIGTWIARRRLDHHRLGFAVQLGTVQAVDRFLEDPLDVTWPTVKFLPDQPVEGCPVLR